MSRFFVKSPYRFLTPLIIVFCAKLAGSLILYRQLELGSSDTYWMTVDWGRESQNEALISGASLSARWPYLFLGWDSAWYLFIIAKGYAFSNQSYAFFPGLPLLAALFNLILQSPLLALVVSSALVGVLWIPIYQLVAEDYLDRSQALKSTLFYAFFPYVFLFTTVAYSEGLFLLSTLGAWHLFKKRKILASTLLASIAAISRPPGLLILLPILFETLQAPLRQRTRKYHKALYLTIPFACYFTWLLYCKITLGDWFAPFTRSAWNDMYTLSAFIFGVLPGYGVQALLGGVLVSLFLSVALLLLMRALTKMDKLLTLYSITYLLGMLAFGALISTPRFVSFLFPVWLLASSRLSQVRQSNLLTAVICAVFWLIGMFLWSDFLNGKFVS